MADDLFAGNTLPAIVLAAALTALLAWRLKPEGFRALAWQSVGIGSGLFWAGLAAVLIAAAWGSYYCHFVPDWYFYAAPFGVVFLYSSIGLGLRWAALRLPGNPVVWFCALGGLEAIPEHAVGIYRFKILEIPLLADSSALSIFIFAYFEYVIYWVLALALAAGVDRLLGKRWKTADLD